MRIASASADGRLVQEHFAHATQFLIWDLDGSDTRLVEARSTTAAGNGAAGNGAAGHDGDRLNRLVALLADCQAVVAARIGPGAGELLARRGIRAFALPEPVDQALHRLISSGVLGDAPEPVLGRPRHH